MFGLLAQRATSQRRVDDLSGFDGRPVGAGTLASRRHLRSDADAGGGAHAGDGGGQEGRVPDRSRVGRRPHPVTAAKKYGARGLGVDLDPDRIREANENVKKEGVGDMVEIRQQNLFETDITKADVISMYLLTDLNLRLRPKLLDLRPGTRLVSHAFSMGDWMPEQKETLPPRYDVYLWIVPAKVEGRWTVQRGEKKFTVDLRQKYQQFTGTAQVDNKTVPVATASCAARTSRSTSDGRQQHGTFRGEVDGDTIKGSGGWQAKRARLKRPARNLRNQRSS